MKTSRSRFFLLLLVSLCWLAPGVGLNAQERSGLRPNERGLAELRLSGSDLFVSSPALNNAPDFHSGFESSLEPPSFMDERGGIKEEIPDKYRDRYEEWKREFLSTEVGRKQWTAYARNTRFTLTIDMSRENQHGAITGRYKWNDSGELVGVTITLGSEIDEGYPDPVYYPVMNSLGWEGASYIISGNMLAATKIAHEFGHVNQAVRTDGRLYQIQNQLMPVYRTIFLTNGYNTYDPRLVKMARQMGGTSVEVWEDREYWGEANAMLYLRDRISEKGVRCSLFTRIKRTVEEYAGSYAKRFKQIAQSKPSLCGWQ